jgi:nitrogen fixation-related uncharacterized protein
MNWDIFILVFLTVMFFGLWWSVKIGQFQDYVLRKFGWIK